MGPAGPGLRDANQKGDGWEPSTQGLVDAASVPGKVPAPTSSPSPSPVRPMSAADWASPAPAAPDGDWGVHAASTTASTPPSAAGWDTPAPSTTGWGTPTPPVAGWSTPTPAVPLQAPPASAGWQNAATPRAAPGRRRVALIVGGIVALLVAVFVGAKAVGDSIAETVREGQAAGVLGSAFATLPKADRTELSRRVEAALEANRSLIGEAKYRGSTAGFVYFGSDRLSDDVVVERLRLESLALLRVGESSCSAIGRWLWTDFTTRPELAAAARRNVERTWDEALRLLPDDQKRRFFEIQVEALEAEVRQSPASIELDEDVLDAAWDDLWDRLSSADRAAIDGLVDGHDTTDAIACEIGRHYYAADGITEAERVAVARSLGTL